MRRILLATDGTSYSEGAIREAIAFAQKCSSKVSVVTVLETNPEYETVGTNAVAMEEAELVKHLDRIRARSAEAGLTCETVLHEGIDPARATVDEAINKHSDMIVVGRRGRTGLAKLLMGEVAAKVIGLAPCKVLVVPRAARIAFKTLLVATDGSAHSNAAVKEAIGIAKCSGSTLVALSSARDQGSVSAPELFVYPVLAEDVVRFVGQPIAVVVAESPALASDAAEVVAVDYDPLDAVVDPLAALAPDAPLLWPESGSNEAVGYDTAWDVDVLEGADVVVHGTFVNQRLAPVPLETNAAAAIPDDRGGLTMYVSTQIPFDVRNDAADALGIARDRLRVIAPDVGGGFGAKLTVYPEYLVVAALALRLGRPVRWIESRSESMVSLTHGRAQTQRVEIGATRDGRIVGLRAEIWADMGACGRSGGPAGR